MSRRSSSSRFTAWAVVLLLVLRAAVPLFAASAAYARGVPVGEVCPVYGVVLPGASHDEHAAHAHDHGGHAAPADDGSQGLPHAGDHCALTGLASLAAPDIATLCAPAPGDQMPGSARPGGSVVHDACASWAARLRHGPPGAA